MLEPHSEESPSSISVLLLVCGVVAGIMSLIAILLYVLIWGLSLRDAIIAISAYYSIISTIFLLLLIRLVGIYTLALTILYPEWYKDVFLKEMLEVSKKNVVQPGRVVV